MNLYNKELVMEYHYKKTLQGVRRDKGWAHFSKLQRVTEKKCFQPPPPPRLSHKSAHPLSELALQPLLQIRMVFLNVIVGLQYTLQSINMDISYVYTNIIAVISVLTLGSQKIF